MMKTVANWCLVFLALMAHLLAAPGEVPATAARPNIVFILADDLGYGDLGVYGAPDIRTPNIDRLAARGVKLTQAYANAAVCTPTRTAFMTGRYQQRVGGLETAIHPGRVHLGLPSSEPTLPRLLGAAGYTTLMSGKWHLGYVPEFYPRAHGFDRFFGDDRIVALIAENARDAGSLRFGAVVKQRSRFGFEAEADARIRKGETFDPLSDGGDFSGGRL